MKYRYRYKNTPGDFWLLSLFFTYGSIVGVCNMIFTAAMILLTCRIWNDTGGFIRILFIMVCCLFPVIQPISIYIRARKQAASSKEIEISFDEAGIHVKSGEENSDLPWRSIKKVSKKPNMVIIFSTAAHGFILTNKILGRQKKDFFNYVISKMNKRP